jgi:hypothetical protein
MGAKPMTPPKSFEKIKSDLYHQAIEGPCLYDDKLMAYTMFDAGYAHAMQSQEVAGLVEALALIERAYATHGERMAHQDVAKAALAKFEGRE